MENIINIDNNLFLKIIDEKFEIKENIINVKNIKVLKVFKSKNIVLKIDFKEIEPQMYKKILKKILFIKNFINNKNNNNKKIFLGYILNFEKENYQQKCFIDGINAIFYNNRYERYNYIYDNVCEYLDGFFYGKNLCDFKNNKCGEKRNTTSVTGCCHHFKHKLLGPLSKMVLCEYLKEDYTCGAKCISCKLFTCDYLESKGIKFKIKDILLLDTFFNPLQKYFIKYMVFEPKEKILKRLMFL